MSPTPAALHLLPRLSLPTVLQIASALPSDAGLSREDLLARWRAAQVQMLQLQEKEADVADEAAVLPIPKAMARHVSRLMALPALAAHHRLVPVAVGLVEVDALMNARPALHDERLQAMAARWPHRPADPELAAICLPLEPAAHADVDVRVLADGGISLTGLESDLECFDGPELAWRAHPPVGKGRPAAAAGLGELQLRLALGPPPPVMHAIRYAGRLLLRKGHHRARTLRSLGLAYLPCLISACVHLDEVRALAPELGEADLAGLFEGPRPSLLRDFDRPSLTQVLPHRPVRCELELRLQVTKRILP